MPWQTRVLSEPVFGEQGHKEVGEVACMMEQEHAEEESPKVPNGQSNKADKVLAGFSIKPQHFFKIWITCQDF